MSEVFDLRRIARKVVEDFPFASPLSLDTLVEVIEGRVPDSLLREALRQCLRPLVEKAFEEFSSLSPPSAPVHPAVHILDTPGPNAGDQAQRETQPFSVAPPAPHPSAPSGQLAPVPHAANAAPRRRTKAALVRTAAQSWLDRPLRVSGGSVSIGAATFEDLMQATQAKRRSAYVSMAKADTLERLAKLLKSNDVSTVSELPPQLLSTFIHANPEIG